MPVERDHTAGGRSSANVPPSPTSVTSSVTPGARSTRGGDRREDRFRRGRRGCLGLGGRRAGVGRAARCGASPRRAGRLARRRRRCVASPVAAVVADGSGLVTLVPDSGAAAVSTRSGPEPVELTRATTPTPRMAVHASAPAPCSMRRRRDELVGAGAAPRHAPPRPGTGGVGSRQRCERGLRRDRHHATSWAGPIVDRSAARPRCGVDLHRAGRAAERPGHVGLGQVGEEPQDEDLPLALRQRRERAVEVDPLRGRLGGGGCRVWRSARCGSPRRARCRWRCCRPPGRPTPRRRPRTLRQCTNARARVSWATSSASLRRPRSW